MEYVAIAVFVLLIILLKTNPPADKLEESKFGSIGNILSLFNKGFSLTGGLRATTRDVAYKNTLVVGPSGSGKTSSVLISTLFTLARGLSSVAILDISGEIFKLVSGYLSRAFKIYCFNLLPDSDCFNPLFFCTDISSCERISHILIKNSGVESKNDPYWSASSELMLSIFIRYLVFYAEPEYCTMVNLALMVETFAAEPEKIDKLIIKSDDPLLIKSYKAMNAVGEKTLQSTVSNTLVAVKIFKNPDVARCTSKNTIPFAKFRTEKSMLFISIPITSVSFLAPLSALLFEQLFTEIMSHIPNKKENAIFCCIDEMATMRFQNIGLVYSNIRKYKAGCMGFIQDERMLEMNWSPAESHAVRTNSYSKVYLKGQPHATCKQLEEIIGKGENNKPVMSASAIRTSDEAIILCGNDLPYKEKMIPFFEHFILRYRTSKKPYVLEAKIPPGPPPLLQFD